MLEKKLVYWGLTSNYTIEVTMQKAIHDFLKLGKVRGITTDGATATVLGLC